MTCNVDIFLWLKSLGFPVNSLANSRCQVGERGPAAHQHPGKDHASPATGWVGHDGDRRRVSNRIVQLNGPYIKAFLDATALFQCKNLLLTG